jgi:small nuclear ribonucleoprotein (snRNP)-like protein
MTLPLEEINKMKGKTVRVILKNGKEFIGKLVSFDLNANVGIEVKSELEFIQGQEVCAMTCETKP